MVKEPTRLTRSETITRYGMNILGGVVPIGYLFSVSGRNMAKLWFDTEYHIPGQMRYTSRV